MNGWMPFARQLGFNGAALVGVRRGAGAYLCRLPGIRFNGAALVGVRRACGSSLESDAPFLASTEPHSLECGEPMQLHGGQLLCGASTEPHSLECGEETADAVFQSASKASTEPHSLECGEARRP